MKKITKILGILLVVGLIATMFVGAGAAKFQEGSSVLTSSGTALTTSELLVPGQTLTAEVNFSFDVTKLGAGDKIKVETAFDTPWSADIIVKGENTSYIDTITSSVPTLDCINIKHLASKADVKVTCTGIIPSSARGKTITPLTVTVTQVSSTSTEDGTAKTSSLPVYNSGDLSSDSLLVSTTIAELKERINNYYLLGAQELGVNLSTIESTISDAETYLANAKAVGASEKISSGNIIRAKECVANAKSSLNKASLDLANKKLEEADSLIKSLEGMNRDVKDLSTLYTSYEVALMGFSTSTDSTKVDELIAKIESLCQEATASINYDPGQEFMNKFLTILPFIIIGVVAAIVAVIVILLIRRRKNSWDELG